MEAVVGQPNAKQSRGWLSPLRIGIAGAVVILLVGGLVFWNWHSKRNSQTAKVNAVIAESQDAYDKGEYVNALNLVRNQADKATSNKQKAQVYHAAAQAAAGANDLQAAAGYYELAHKADPSTEKADAYVLANLYMRLEQKDKALEQYKLALEYAKSAKNEYQSDVSAIQAEIDELEGE